MLPSRGIVRSLPSGAFQRQTSAQPLSRTLPRRRLGDGRQFGTVMNNSRSALRANARVGVVGMAAPAGARALSVWGYTLYGKKKTEEPATETVTPTTQPEPAVQSPVAEPVVQEPISAVTADPVAAASSAASDAPVLPTDLDLTSIANLGSTNILDMPEEIGYLSNLGLDYGWGPTSVMQWTLEHMHIYTGLGWGGSIIATALALRVIMFYPQIRSMRVSATLQEMKKDPRSKEAMQLVQKGYMTNDRETLQKGQFLNKMLKKEYGASTLGIFWSFLQIPFSFGLFRIISGMAHIPVPSLENAGYLWFTDLTASDPYFILPAAGSALLFGAMVINSKYAPAQQKAMMKKMMWVFGTVGFVGTTFLSAGVNLMMVSTGTATLLQSVILNTESIRRVVGLPIPPVEEIKYEAPRPVSPGISGLRERLENNMKDMKKGLSDQVNNYTGQYQGTEADRAEKKRRENLRKVEEMRKDLQRSAFERKYKQ